ncbi:MAG: formylglycine-generating enzyme family protein [Nitrospirota bacterium]|nr:formylglycine-generating enzyme family protein [Nitrospirota bacterium]
MKTRPSLLATCLLAFIPLLAVSGCKNPPPGMVDVPTGPFVMGTNTVDTEGRAEELGLMITWFDAERPERTVPLARFFMDQDEVTNARYAAFVKATNHQAPPHWNGQSTPPQGLEQHPVTHVTWYDARDFCAWDGHKELPTEAQWEKAARGTSGLVYPWGNSFDPEAANVARNNTAPVGSFLRGNSPYGVRDMIGNVWEWTADWYLPYPGSTHKDEKFGQKYRVLRGNSWASPGHFPDHDQFNEVVANNSRASFRLFLSPEGRVNDVGFRCAQGS